MENTTYTVTLNVNNMLDKISLKIVVSVHFVLTIFASMDAGLMAPAYSYMNTILLLTGLWAIATPDSKDSVLMFVVFLLVSFIMDIVFLAVGWHNVSHEDRRSSWRFSATMAIFNILIKPVTAIITGLEFRKRGGEYSMPGLPGGSHPGGGYENIDHSIPTNQQVEAAQSPSSLDKPYIPQ